MRATRATGTAGTGEEVAAVAVVDTAIRIDHYRNGCLLFIIDTVRAELHAGSTLHTSQNVNDRISIFRHVCFLLLHK